MPKVGNEFLKIFALKQQNVNRNRMLKEDDIIQQQELMLQNQKIKGWVQPPINPLTLGKKLTKI